MIQNSRKKPGIKVGNILILLICCTIAALTFLKLKNNSINLYESNNTLRKKLSFYQIEVENLLSEVTSLKRADRIRIFAEEQLGMYYPEPESLDVIISDS